MNLKQCQVFVQAVRAGSFTKAASQLGCSQAAVSQAVGGLEAELGLRLLHRSRSVLRLTAAGELLLPELEAMLSRQRAVLELAEGLRGGERGTVVVASFSSVAVHWLPDIFKAFGEKHPGVSLRLNTGDYHDVAQWLSEGTAAVGFVTLPYPEGDCVPLYEDRLLAVLPADHPLAGGDCFPVEKAAGEPFLSLPASSDQDARVYLEANGVQPDIRLSTKDDYTLVAMVASGLGMSIMPELLLKGEHPGVRLLELRPRASRTIALALSEEGKTSPAAAAFAAFAQSWVRQFAGRGQTT